MPGIYRLLRVLPDLLEALRELDDDLERRNLMRRPLFEDLTDEDWEGMAPQSRKEFLWEDLGPLYKRDRKLFNTVYGKLPLDLQSMHGKRVLQLAMIHGLRCSRIGGGDA